MRSGRISIHICDVIDEIDDEDLLREVQSRKLSVVGPREETDLDIVREAHGALVRGYAIEARCILERLLFPKWKNSDACASQYASYFKSGNGA